MLRRCDQLEVFDAVVESIMVAVMHLLPPLKPPADVLFHNPAVLKHAAAVRCFDLPIATFELII
jgi:hypothetical protein